MSDKIIFNNDNGGVSVISPTNDALVFLTINDIAKKDVPKGKKYLIIDDTDLPSREYRAAWTIDEELLIDGVGE
tara:strand:+ start:3875 stop:4096 length:222 start_codon:yes stop_codon:yes gene_type:complete